MKITLFYNDFKKEIDLDVTKKNGIIQNELLNYCSLLIYNIEYSEVNINNEKYILGEEHFDFNKSLEDSLLSFFDSINDIDSLEISIYDRKRDSNGNVVKNNLIIDKYNKWFMLNEDENLLNRVHNENGNRHILRFPLESVLQNILRASFTSSQYAVDYTNDNIHSDNLQNDIESDTQSDPHYEIEQAQPSNNDLNFFINMFDSYIRNNEMDNDYSDLPDLVPIEDVKVVLEEEKFNNIENVLYENLDLSEVNECLICTEAFSFLDTIKKIKCNHLFHTDCIKPWLCHESNKCPVCRIDVDIGTYK
jgi:hypothetical protein